MHITVQTKELIAAAELEGFKYFKLLSKLLKRLFAFPDSFLISIIT